MSDLVRNLHSLTNVFDRAETLISSIERDLKFEDYKINRMEDIVLMKSKIFEMRKNVIHLIREVVNKNKIEG